VQRLKNLVYVDLQANVVFLFENSRVNPMGIVPLFPHIVKCLPQLQLPAAGNY